MRSRTMTGLLLLASAACLGCSTKAEQCAKEFDKPIKSKDSFAICQAACDVEGDPDSCQITSWCVRDGDCEGHRQPGDFKGALAYIERACALAEQAKAKGGDPAKFAPISCKDLNLPRCLADPAPCEQRCEAGDALECARMADLYWRGWGNLKGDRQRALALYRRACDRGFACLAGGYATACKLGDPNVCIARCEQGEADACYWTAALFREGSGTSVLRDDAKALQYLEKACKADATISARCATLGQAEATP